ncbi:MAG: hypothetical protein AABO41_11750 [Acidobacteriota bacterium]
MESNISGFSEKQSGLGLVIDQLYAFFFKSRKQQYVVYAVTFLVAFSYAIVSDLGFGKPQHEVVIESMVLASVLLISLPLAYVLGRIRRVERSSIKLHSTEPSAWGQALGEPSFAFASAFSRAHIGELTNALRMIQSNEERQRHTQDLIATLISSIDKAQQDLPYAIKDIAQSISKGQSAQLQDQLDGIGRNLQETISVGLSVALEHRNTHLVAMLSEAIEKHNQDFVRLLSQTLEQQTGNFSTLLEQLAQIPESSERDRFRARIRERQDVRRSGTFQTLEFRRSIPKRNVIIYDAEGRFIHVPNEGARSTASTADQGRVVYDSGSHYGVLLKEEKPGSDTPEAQAPEPLPQNVK